MLDAKKVKKVQINNNLKTLGINHLLDLRSHLGHKLKYTHYFAEGFILGNIDSISIYHIEKIWKSLKLFYEILVNSFFRRNSFFLVMTNKNISSESLSNVFHKTFKKKDNNINSFYVLGYINKDWYGGLLANWTRIYILLKKFLNEKSKLTKKRIKTLQKLKGVWTRQLNPTFPDFILTLDSNKKAFHESRLMRLPVLGLCDVDTNPFNLSVYVPGNDDSFDNSEFFLIFLNEAIKDGRLKEQELFFHMMVNKLQKIIEQESF